MLRRLDETNRQPIDAEVAASTAIGATGRMFFKWLIGARTTHFDTHNHDLRRKRDATLRSLFVSRGDFGRVRGRV